MDFCQKRRKRLNWNKIPLVRNGCNYRSLTAKPNNFECSKFQRKLALTSACVHCAIDSPLLFWVKGGRPLLNNNRRGRALCFPPELAGGAEGSDPEDEIRRFFSPDHSAAILNSERGWLKKDPLLKSISLRAGEGCKYCRLFGSGRNECGNSERLKDLHE
ncbi:hypothetical protein AVEN_101319-1 [Araneus ventricosus]|uniref:Uncharacterized protein n=1 Tax=Araneus ventricosus TaxID=182803 RepID=A0A4Y2RUL1_ARAVE|nr:hypothetical protein AVEN_101319-1 [Araneus ventricosus]